ncbi:MAG: Fe2+ or Zn2+ uptake regulation protein [Granulosicoccus sp.]|jgi:Fur family ferric uptake transcriptional regulator
MIRSEISQRQNPVDVSKALKAVGLQITAQRLAVYRAVCSSPHSIADEISKAVRLELGVISRQAVYDALKVMSEHGIIRRIQPSGSAARYEHRVDNHHHLACRNCGNLIDIDCAVGQAPCLIAEHDHGYKIDEAEVTYWGVCPACQDTSVSDT